MERFPDHTHFKYPWRDYQQRVLDELASHMQDEHLHVVAPPGSGKTVLGLEVMRRLDRPTLICSPSLALRDQWVERFCELFLHTHERPQWISCNLARPGFLTVTTYQALHAAMDSDEARAQGIVDGLRRAQVSTLVLDEAHHLKNAWWRALSAVKSALQPAVVALTATPPYDVTGLEWNRYLALNGDVDAEIPVPELVRAGDLCAHQDYLYFSNPTAGEAALLARMAQARRTLAMELLASGALKDWLLGSHWLSAPTQHLDWLYEHLDLYLAGLSFLRAAGLECSPEQLSILAVEGVRPPVYDPAQLTVLLNGFLNQKDESLAEAQAQLIGRLKRAGLFHRGKVDLLDSERRQKLLTASAGKLHSVVDIARAEHQNLGDYLRLVILADFIRPEYLGQPEALKKLGVIPIFEALRVTQGLPAEHLAVLTGQWVIVPRAVETSLRQLVQQLALVAPVMTPLACDPRFVQLSVRAGQDKSLVQLLTRLFELGQIRLLVGTAALLGEGWDAPSVNALILASGVGSYVQSNQMRGRAIRSHQDKPHKASNIWHLACVDIGEGSDPESRLGADYQLLKRRFDTFVGVSVSGQAVIANGLGRVHLSELMHHHADVAQMNQAMLDQAARRDHLRNRWWQALAAGRALVDGMRLPYPKDRHYEGEKKFVLTRSLASLLAAILLALTFWLDVFPYLMLNLLKRSRDPEIWLRTAAFLLVLSALYFGWRFVRYGLLWLRYRDIGKDLGNIGRALLQALAESDLLSRGLTDYRLYQNTDVTGEISLSLEGGSRYDRNLFVQSLEEVVGLINNPRYVLVRRSQLKNLLSQKDFHNVPEKLGAQKPLAQRFASAWQRQVGQCDLVYTRTLAGRKFLLKARVSNLAYQLQDKAERQRSWR